MRSSLVFAVGFGVIAVGLFVSVGEGCGGAVSTAQSGSSASQTIGAAGGTVTSADGQASVSIPAGALTADTAITIAPLASAAIADATAVGTGYQFGPSGTQFASPVTVTLPFDASKIVAPSSAADVIVFTAPDGASTFTAAATTAVDTTHVSAPTTHFSTFLAAIPGGDEITDAGPGGATDGGEDVSNCVLMCEGPDDIDGGIGCGCGVTCEGIYYQVQCVCGACTCYQDGVAGATTTNAISSCDQGAQSLGAIYFNTCGYPAAKNKGGSSGPTSGDGGGSCP